MLSPHHPMMIHYRADKYRAPGALQREWASRRRQARRAWVAHQVAALQSRVAALKSEVTVSRQMRVRKA